MQRIGIFPIFFILGAGVFTSLASSDTDSSYRAFSMEAGLRRGFTRLAVGLQKKPESGLLLSVPFHRQEHALSCEAATVRMALLYRRVDVSELQLLGRLPFDPTPRTAEYWGDPYKGFVGDIDGKMLKTGYGVYWGPIAKLASYWRPSYYFTGGSIEKIVQELERGNPIIVWNHVGTGKTVYWKTPEEKIIKGIDGEHTRVVIGFSGDRLSPRGFHLLDPIYGKMYFSTQDFLAQWAKFDYAGVVVE